MKTRADQRQARQIRCTCWTVFHVNTCTCKWGREQFRALRRERLEEARKARKA